MSSNKIYFSDFFNIDSRLLEEYGAFNVSGQFHYTKVNRFMPFLLAEILNFQGSTHHIGVGSFS